MPDVLSLGRAISLWEGSLRASRKAPSTVKAYVNAVTLIEHALGANADPAAIGIGELEAIMASWRIDANTQRNRLVAWREFFRWGARRHAWPRIADQVELPKRSTPALRRLTHAEVEAMLSARAVERAQTTVWLLAYLACRIGEVTQLRWRDIDLVAGRATIQHQTAKGRKGRVIPMPPALVEYLASVKDARGDVHTHDDAYLIPHRRRAQFIPEDEAIIWTQPTSQMTIGRILKAVAEQAGVRAPDEVTAHMLRRFYLEHALDNGMDMYVAAAIAGHASIQTTAGYGGGASLAATTRAVQGLRFGAPQQDLQNVQHGRTWDRTKVASQEPDPADGGKS